MNKFVKVLIILVLLPLSISVPVFLAQSIALDSQVYAQQSTLQQRVEDYKTKLGTAPSQTELNRLKLRCSVAQTALKTLSTRVGSVQEKRVDAYDTINKNLTDLIAALKAKSINTTQLEAQSKELKTKTDTFATDLKAYKQSVEDAASADCSGDPLALRAALEEARKGHTKLVTEVGDIRAYINNVIKPTLKQVRADVITQQGASQSTTGDTNGSQ